MASSSTTLARMSAVKGARTLLLEYLEQAETAVARLSHSRDTEALHDLRVALRHVRTYLSTYRELFSEAVPDKGFKALRTLAHLTNPARDAEVQSEWLAGQSRTHRGTSTATSELRSRLTRHHAELLVEIRERFARDFPRLSSRLRDQLESARDTKRRTFGQYTAKQVRRQSRRLRKRLDRIEGVADVEGCHTARIAAKRVRYLLEPFSSLRGMNPLIQRLKDLQDTLGEVHDLHVLLETLSEESESARHPQRRMRGAGLGALASTARERLIFLYAQLAQRGLGEVGQELNEALDQAASTLRKTGASKP